jgi:hypothetical protein
MDYAPGARYCHCCGGSRESNVEPFPQVTKTSEPETDTPAWLRRMGVSVPCLTCLIVALVFAAAALLTGVIYQEDTLVNWQAVQTWRIEFLLGAVVALLAGILLKRPSKE